MSAYERELVQNLLNAEERENTEDMAFFENELLDHIEWTGDCEQGLTPEAAAELQAFVDRIRKEI